MKIANGKNEAPRVLWVGGTRNYWDWQILNNIMLKMREEHKFNTIATGGATGADELARAWAKLHGIDYIEIRADWKRYGRAAGPIRNKELAQLADIGLFFWDGESPGTRGAIDLSLKHCETTEIEYFHNPNRGRAFNVNFKLRRGTQKRR